MRCSDSAMSKRELDLGMSFVFYVELQGSDIDEEDLKELLNDTRLLKKLKKGQISAEDFEKQITTEQKTKQKPAGPSHDGSKDDDV